MASHNFNLTIHPEVPSDLQEGIDYYNSKAEGLGRRFYETAKARIDSLKQDGLLYAVRYENVRCSKVPSFPYLIHYRVDMGRNTVFIDTVINTHKDPDENWGKRD